MDRTDLDETEHYSVINNCLHSLFSQCSVTLNGIPITPSKNLYNYRAYHETLLTHGEDAATSHLTNAFWYLDTGNVIACDPTAATTTTTDKGAIDRWNRSKQRKVVEMYGRMHSDLFNVPQLLLPGVQIQIKFTKSKKGFYLLVPKNDTEAVFKFIDVTYVK